MGGFLGCLVRGSSELDLSWAKRILGWHVPFPEVAGLRVVGEEVGTTTRLRLWVDHRHEGLPRGWFIKLPSLLWRARWITALSGLLYREVRFYRELAAEVPVCLPRVIFAGARLGCGVVLVLEDLLVRGVEFGGGSDGLDLARLEVLVDRLALLHGRYWGSIRFRRDLRWLGSLVRYLEDGLGSVLAVPLVRRGWSKVEGLSEDLYRDSLEYARRRRRMVRVLRGGVPTLVHHDLHPGNIYWGGGEPGFLDWQLVRMGEGVGDLSYLLALGMLPEQRRLHSRGLLERYREGLRSCGVGRGELMDLEFRYRLHLVYAFEAMLLTLALGGMMEEGLNRELLRRAALAVEEEGGFDALFFEARRRG